MKKRVYREIYNKVEENEKRNHITIEDMIKEPEKEFEILEAKEPVVEVKVVKKPTKKKKVGE